MNGSLNGKLNLAVQIFENSYSRKFFHQLVSSQLDIDRLDYLNRDAYFTGVNEGTVGAERIIKMLNVAEDQIVVEEKGIYSVENFLNTRRFMYWQIYFHKATISAEVMLVQLVKRAAELIKEGIQLPASSSLLYFLKNRPGHLDISRSDEVLNNFARLDDYDIWTSIKLWSDSDDYVLRDLSNRLLNRQLFKVELANKAFSNDRINEIKASLKKQYKLNEDALPYFLIDGEANNAAYVSNDQKIMVLMKDGRLQDIADASELPNIKAISKIVKKFYLCYPKNVSL